MDSGQEDSRIVIIGTDKEQMLHKFGAFYVKDQPLAFYIGKNSDIRIPGKKLTEANSYFSGILLISALRELHAYLREHMDDREMYRTEQFWKDALKYAGRTITPHVFWIDFRPVSYGYFIIHTSDCKASCSYSLIDNTFTFQHKGNESDPVPTLVEFCYHGLLDQLLAQSHADNGTAPDAYMEIARLNGFLRDKRSVRCDFKNSRTYQSFSRDPFTADCLISEAHGKFVINPNGYRDFPGKDAGLPVMFRNRSAEFSLNTDVFENLDIEVDDKSIRQAAEKEDLMAKIAGMIPPGTWYPFCKVEMKTAKGRSRTIFHPSNLDTRDDLLKLDAVMNFLRQYCDETGLQADFVNYSIGAGSPAPMPDEVFALLGQVGQWLWYKLPHFAESSVHSAEFDADFLFDLLYGKDEVSWDKESPLLRGKILASIPEGVSYDFSTVRIIGEKAKAEDTVSGEIDDEDTIRELPLFFGVYEGNQEETELYVATRCYHAGSGSHCDMPEDLLKLVKKYGVEDFAAEGIVRAGREKSFNIQFMERIGDGSDYDGGIATKLMPKSVRKKLLKSRLYSKDKQGTSAEVVVKYFNPCGAGTWLITEGEEQENGDWLLFGMCHIFEWEWGYVLLSELENMRLPYGLKIERDLYSEGTVAELRGEDEDEDAA